MKVIVYHDLYGCETGCCGHRIELEDGRESFDFEHNHPQKDPVEFAKRLVTQEFGEEHCKDLDWANCKVSNGDDGMCP